MCRAAPCRCGVPTYGLQNTTVYLLDDLKADLERTAVATGRSAAELIRVGIRLAIVQQSPPAPAPVCSTVMIPGSPNVSTNYRQISGSSDPARYRRVACQFRS
jgi:hypothetical protein